MWKAAPSAYSEVAGAMQQRCFRNLSRHIRKRKSGTHRDRGSEARRTTARVQQPRSPSAKSTARKAENPKVLRCVCFPTRREMLPVDQRGHRAKLPFRQSRSSNANAATAEIHECDAATTYP